MPQQAAMPSPYCCGMLAYRSAKHARVFATNAGDQAGQHQRKGPVSLLAQPLHTSLCRTERSRCTRTSQGSQQRVPGNVQFGTGNAISHPGRTHFPGQPQKHHPHDRCARTCIHPWFCIIHPSMCLLCASGTKSPRDMPWGMTMLLLRQSPPTLPIQDFAINECAFVKEQVAVLQAALSALCRLCILWLGES